MLLLRLVFLGFWGRVGRAAREGFAPCGTGGLGLTDPPGELEEDVALGRGAGSGLVSIRGGLFSGEPVGVQRNKEVILAALSSFHFNRLLLEMK